LDAGIVLFGPTCLEPDAPALIGRRVQDLFRAA
jgi:hypothetical protein